MAFHLDGLDCLLDVVVVFIHGVEFFIDHEVGGSEFIVDVFGIGLEFLYFWVRKKITVFQFVEGVLEIFVFYLDDRVLL